MWWPLMAGDLTEDDVPREGLFKYKTRKKFDRKKHTARTRTGLAVASLITLCLLYGTLLALLVFKVITLDELTNLIVAFSGLQTLAAVAFAFYCAKSD